MRSPIIEGNALNHNPQSDEKEIVTEANEDNEGNCFLRFLRFLLFQIRDPQ